MSSFITALPNAIRSLSLPSLKQVQEGLQGFSASFHTISLTDYADAMHRGASPNTTLLRGAQMDSLGLSGSSLAKLLTSLGYFRSAWLITPFLFFLPVIINGWPRQGANNDTFEWIREALRETSQTFSNSPRMWVRWRGALLYGLYWLIDCIPYLENTYLIRFFNFLDKYLLPLSLLLLTASYIGLYMLGNTLLPIVAGLTLGFGILDRMNYMPLFLRNLFNSIGLHVAILSGLILGTPYEMITSAIAAPFFYGHFIGFKQILSFFFNFFDATRWIAERLTEQDKQVPRFDFRCHTSQFEEALLTMANKREHTVIRAHVLDNDNLLPPALPNQNLADLLTLFDDIEWNRGNRRVMRQTLQQDWRTKREAQSGVRRQRGSTAQARHAEKVAYLRNNLQIFIRRIQQNNIHSIRVGGEDLVKRYAQNLTSLLNQLNREIQNKDLSTEERQSKLNTLADKLITLSTETGEYCGIALLRSTEEIYRSLLSAEGEATAKQRVRMIHQLSREQFFQAKYHQRHLNIVDREDDTHAYTRAVELYAPKLGLPGQFAQYDVVAISSPLMKDLFSAFSSIEAEFWETPKHTSVEALGKQIRNAFNTPLLPVRTVDQWYQSFIDQHTFGTEDEKNELKMNFPYTVDMHDHMPFYRLRPEIITLMLLDFGIIALAPIENAPENFYRPDALIPGDDAPEPVHEATGRNILGYLWGNDAPAAANAPARPVAPANDRPHRYPLGRRTNPRMARRT